ncbi:DUF1800 domain-containing protein [Ponticaulis sp.]|uniref:DUF1800 domain-containing protein n=1 Tax=Ponticaulis sp. TaxID=2020902 RepID=UPI000B756001|nr:DUF1800 domain-containing protein [Ponticaulis sp.]MAI90255.1 hypothetical protein [Ponticaulis sp.]OUX99898.1 MAG: hypothetical protein CBB65_07425 [Hyphomonadaceae bacterium TMED5]|tara:strand:- start:232847 stop:234691 length:1845 start_codon:yes stop_codon:yes gene_type:complete
MANRGGRFRKFVIFSAASLTVLAACSGGGGGGGNSNPPSGNTPTPTPTPTPTVSPTPTPTPTPTQPVASDDVFSTAEKTARFLTQATFGPTPSEIETLTGTNASDWFQAQLLAPISQNLPYVTAFLASPDGRHENGYPTFPATNSPRASFYLNAIQGQDQLRQRMAFAFSQIMVISNISDDDLSGKPEAVAYYQDVLATHALGNFRDLLEAVTYIPAMGEYLTFLQNRKGNENTGRMPDENYAREVMQLFTIGLSELNLDGSERTDGTGAAIETYTNDDITGLARVFTGLSLNADAFWYTDLPDDAWTSPMVAYPDQHSSLEKTFLGTTIPAGTGPEESIDIALDTLFNHPNVGPFIGRQLIQRFTTSSPAPDYVSRVATAFNSGSYTLPNGDVVGTGQRGDLAATIAAVLMDEDAIGDAGLTGNTFGKIREPVIRFVHWARAFNAAPLAPENAYYLMISHSGDLLSQSPYGSPSVFNFYRPGYIAPGTLSGEAGLTVPELQIMNAGTIPGYANFMTYFTHGYSGYSSNVEDHTFLPDYSTEIELADDVDALLDHLSTFMTYDTLSPETRQNIADLVSAIYVSGDTDPEDNGRLDRVKAAVLLIMTSPDYLVQR